MNVRRRGCLVRQYSGGYAAPASAVPDPESGKACCEVLSLSSSVVENRAGGHSRQKTRPQGSRNYRTAGTFSLVAQSGATSQKKDRLVFPAGQNHPAGAAAARRVPCTAGGRNLTAVYGSRRHPADDAAVACDIIRTSIIRGKNSSGRRLQRRLRPPDDPDRKLCSRSLLAGGLTLGRLGSWLSGAGLGLG